MVGTNSRNTVFVSYSHADAGWLQRLRIHLAPLYRDQVLDLWDDTKILPGQDWRKEIENALARARVAVLLISADFLASDFISSEELPRLLAAAEAGGATILPVIVSASRFADIPALCRFQAVNAPNRPLNTLGKAAREEVLVAVSAAVERALTTPIGLEGPRLDVGDTHQIPPLTEGSSPRSDEEGDGKEYLTSEEPDPLSAVSDNDPLVFFPAIAALPITQESYELLLDTTYYSVAHDEALKTWLARDADRAGQFLADTIRHCPVTGPGWFRARRAGELFSRSLRSLNDQVYELVRSGRIEPMRHALVAYGHLGNSLSPNFLKAKILTDEYEAEKALSYAVGGWTAAYVTAKGWEIDPSGNDLRECMKWYWTDFSNVWPKPTVDLRAVSSAHYDDLSTRWLDEQSPSYVKKAALRALGERGVTRAVTSIARLLTADDVETREDAARALGQIGGVAAAEILFALPEGEPYRQQIVYVAHELNDDTMDELIHLYGSDGNSWTDTWLARSIGLARADRHRNVILRNLGSQLPPVRGVSAIAAARLALPLDLAKVVSEAEPGAERAMATAALLMFRPSEYSKVERAWRRDLVGSLHQIPARLVEDIFQCVADVPEANLLVDSWRPVAETWGARF
jgi:HEAT repeat protein